MLLAPLSEFFGRRPVYIVSFGLSAIFQLPIALASNIETVMICRFLCGFFGSAPLANTGGVVHDLFGRDEGGLAVGIYALSSTDGPPLGNVVGVSHGRASDAFYIADLAGLSVGMDRRGQGLAMALLVQPDHPRLFLARDRFVHARNAIDDPRDEESEKVEGTNGSR